MFKTLSIFTLAGAAVDFTSLLESEPREPAPPGPLEVGSSGLQLPLRTIPGDAALFGSFVSHQKQIPVDVINAAMDEKLAAIEEAEGRRPGGRERRRIRDDLIHDLLPRAFNRTRKIHYVIDVDAGLIIINGTKGVAESVVSAIRGELGSFPAVPLTASVAPLPVLGQLFAHEDDGDGDLDFRRYVAGHTLAPDLFARTTDAVGEGRNTFTSSTMQDDVEKELFAGRLVDAVTLYVDDKVRLRITSDMGLSQIKLLDGAIEGFDEKHGLDGEESHYRDFMTLHYARVLVAILQGLFIPPQES